MTMCAHRWRDRDPRCECPEEALRASIDGVLSGLSAWVTGGSYCVTRERWSARDVRHSRHIATWQPLLEALDRGYGSARVAARATDVLDVGLQQRAGAFGGVLALTLDEHRTYRLLLDLGAEHALIDPVAVCEDCRVVFRPARKAHAARCSRCHSSPRPATPAPRGNTPAAIARALADGWKPYRATIARETFAWCEICTHRMEGRAHERARPPADRARRVEIAGSATPGRTRSPTVAHARTWPGSRRGHPTSMTTPAKCRGSRCCRCHPRFHAPACCEPLHRSNGAGR
jgi:hypothetical protein